MKHFAPIPATLLGQGLPHGVIILYAEIIRLSHKKGYSWATNAHFAAQLDVTPRAIQRWLATLEELKLIEFQDRATNRRIVPADSLGSTEDPYDGEEATSETPIGVTPGSPKDDSTVTRNKIIEKDKIRESSYEDSPRRVATEEEAEINPLTQKSEPPSSLSPSSSSEKSLIRAAGFANAFDAFSSVMIRRGHTAAEANKLLGKLRKEHGADKVDRVLGKCIETLPTKQDPFAYLSQSLKEGNGKPKKFYH